MDAQSYSVLDLILNSYPFYYKSIINNVFRNVNFNENNKNKFKGLFFMIFFINKCKNITYLFNLRSV